MSEDTDLKAFDAEFDGEDVLTESEETPASETKEEVEVEESKEESEELTEEESSEESEEEVKEESEESEEPEAESDGQTDDQKEQARKAYEARQQARLERQQAQEELAKQHLEAAQDEQDLALRQLQIDAYNNKVNANSDRLTNQYEKALNSIEVFKEPTPEVAEYLNQAIDEFEARFVQMDELGNPVSVNGDLYAFLQTKAGLVEKLTQLGARREKQSSAKEKAAVTPAPSAPAKEPKQDAAVKAFDDEFDRW
mgnify:CR=1 FL=1